MVTFQLNLIDWWIKNGEKSVWSVYQHEVLINAGLVEPAEKNTTRATRRVPYALLSN